MPTRLRLDVPQLLTEHPPAWRHRNKRFLAGLLERTPEPGTIELSRWEPMELPTSYQPGPLEVRVDADVFQYHDPGRRFDWHLNFADRNLFCAYGSPLFAQDEIMVCEHPALASALGAMEAAGIPLLTVQDERPTPVLLAGVPRWGAFDTHQVYGNAFSRASESAIVDATTVLEPATLSNILAIEAPPGGHGRYRSMEIEYIFETAYSGFRAAKLEAERLRPGAQVGLHTGFWGCGAFGGNRTLMILAQVVAARLAELDLIHFHAVDAAGRTQIERILKDGQTLLSAATTTAKLVSSFTRQGFEWGVSDGN